MTRCPECLTWMDELASSRPVSVPGRRAHWDDDEVYGCEKCGWQYRQEDDALWIQGEPCEECDEPATHEFYCDEHQEIAA